MNGSNVIHPGEPNADVLTETCETPHVPAATAKHVTRLRTQDKVNLQPKNLLKGDSLKDMTWLEILTEQDDSHKLRLLGTRLPGSHCPQGETGTPSQESAGNTELLYFSMIPHAY